MTEQELIEQLADKEHESWSRWMDYLFSKCTYTMHGDAVIPMALALRWKIQTNTPYERLSEREKQSDRDEVAHILPIIDEYVKQATTTISNVQMEQSVRLHPNAMVRAIKERENQ